MMTGSPLSTGAIKRICEGKASPSEPLWLQVTTIKLMDRTDNNPNGIRYKYPDDDSRACLFRMSFSDSVHHMQGIAGPTINSLFDSKAVDINSIVQVVNHGVTVIKGHWILKVFEISPSNVIKMTGKIGEPANIDVVLPPPAEAAKPAASNPPPPVHGPPVHGPPVHAPSLPVPSVNAPVRPLSRTPVKPMRAPAVQDSMGPVVMPISALSPYTEAWTIKARCTQKSDIKTWANAKGEGKLFSATLIDATGEIRVTGFNDQVDQFYDILQVGSIYTVSSSQVKPSKRAFNTTKNDYEIHLGGHSVVEIATDENVAIPTAHYAFVPIRKVGEMEKDTMVDVCAIVKEVTDLSSITTKTKQQQLSKRDLLLVDESLCSIKLTIWGSQAEQYDTDVQYPAIVVKAARISDFGGRTLSTTTGGSVAFNTPDVEQVIRLKTWFERTGRTASYTPLTSSPSSGGGADFGADTKTIAQMQQECLGVGDRSDYATVVATVGNIRDASPIVYLACPTEGCGKKLQEEGPSMYRCERCVKTLTHADHRFSFSMQIGDETGQQWVSVFNEPGKALFPGYAPAQLYDLQAVNDPEFHAALSAVKSAHPYTFRMRARQDTFGGETRVKYHVMSVAPLDLKRDNEQTMNEVENLMMAMQQ